MSLITPVGSLARVGKSLWLTIERPQAQNALTPAVLDLLAQACDEIERDRALRALVITGTGRAFSVGMDITFLGDCFADPLGTFVPFVSRYHDLLLRLERLPVLVIAAVNGLARAGGFELLLAADLVVVADEAKIGDVHLGSGVPPAGGATFRSRRALGEQRARDLLYTARWMKADECLSSGLAARIFPTATFRSEVEAFVSQITNTSLSALDATKRAFEETRGLNHEEAAKAELAIFTKFVAEDPQANEGHRSFVEKRAPQWN